MAEKICGSLLYAAGAIVISVACAKQNISAAILGGTWMICGQLILKEVK